MTTPPLLSLLTLRDIAPHAALWSRSEIEQLKAFADALFIAKCGKERVASALHEIMQGRSGGGYVENKVIRGKSYCYLRYRSGGKLRSVYLGRTECFAPKRSAESDAARGYRNVIRILCRLTKISRSCTPMCPLELAVYLALAEKRSDQIERVIQGKPPQARPKKRP
jgi:hypothetical protein